MDISETLDSVNPWKLNFILSGNSLGWLIPQTLSSLKQATTKSQLNYFSILTIAFSRFLKPHICQRFVQKLEADLLPSFQPLFSINSILTLQSTKTVDFYLFILQYWGVNSGPTPLATPPALLLWSQEAEIRRIVVWSQPEQIVLWNPISKNPSHKNKKGWWSSSRCRPWVQNPVLKKGLY
jgi:hypothetical protein